MALSQFHYVKRAAVNTSAWDSCIEKSPNGLIYARSFYLDNMADNWDAIILNDYEAVMPLPWRRKWGIRYVYQLPFVQRLGVFGSSVNGEIIKEFYRKAIEHISYLDYKIDTASMGDTMVARSCVNLIIDLSQPYSEIRNAFSSECRKNIRKAESRGCLLSTKATAMEIVSFFKIAYGKYYPQYNGQTYQMLLSLIGEGIRMGKCETYAVANKENAVVFAAALFRDEKRIYYCVGAPNEEGRQMRAAYFFINEILKRYAYQPLLFDFEGSDLPNVASFYNKFGPASETYSEVRINHLPFPLRWLKK